MKNISKYTNLLGVSVLVLLMYSCGSSKYTFTRKREVQKYSAQEVQRISDSIWGVKPIDTTEILAESNEIVATKDTVSNEIIATNKNLSDTICNNLIEDEKEKELDEVWGTNYEFTDRERTTISSTATNFFKDGNSVKVNLDELSQKATFPFDGIFTSNFGFRRGRGHKGIDISARNGAKDIKAFMDGVVRISKYMSGFGNVLVIRHENGMETVYAHCRKNHVKSGDIVNSGQVVATVGSTGRSTGPHLHFEIRIDGIPVDPNFFMNPKEKTMKHGLTYIHKFDKYTVLASNESQKSKVIVKRYHKIRSGDTLSRLSYKYGVSIKNLCKMNNIKTTTILRIGRQLRVS